MAPWQNLDIPYLIDGVDHVAVVHGGEAGAGVLDLIDERILPGATAAQISQHRMVTVQTSLFPTLKNGNNVSVDGVTCKVVQRKKKEGDDALTQLLVCLPNP